MGHVNPAGGGQLNPFGSDFASAGHQWTVSLCNKDSDGDGVSNGMELGDPACVWKVGRNPFTTAGITNPGLASGTTAPPASGGEDGGGDGPESGGSAKGGGGGGGGGGGRGKRRPHKRHGLRA